MVSLHHGNLYVCILLYYTAGPMNFPWLQHSVVLSIGGLLIARTSSVLLPMTLATSMAARQGPVPMAGHQICVQVWLTMSLLTDALAIAGQVMASSSPSKRERERETICLCTFWLSLVWVAYCTYLGYVNWYSAFSIVTITCLVFVFCCSASTTLCNKRGLLDF